MGGFDTDSRIDSGIQIDNVQSFAEIIGDNIKLWKLLIGREVSNRKREVTYNYKDGTQETRKIKYFIQGKVNKVHKIKSAEISIYVSYGNGGCLEFIPKIFIEQFDRISPPISLEEITKLLHREHESSRLKAEIQEAEKREVQRREQEVEKRQVEKQILLKSLKEQFEQNFLNSYNFYQANCSEHILLLEYQTEKSKYVKSWVKQHLCSEPDLEQAAAIGAVEGHVQVVARAGSGKTSTLVNRALFLQKHCRIAADEMLLLAFNRKAAEEIQERLTSQLQDSIPHVMTFHALAYALVHPEESLLFDEPDGAQNKSRALQSVIDAYLHEPDYYEEIRTLMMAHFREDWERIASGGYDKSPEEMLRYRRSLSREGLDGTYLKSFGEKVIADFLFEHDIKYRYERNFWWNEINYRPDFTIFTGDNQGIIIEYFGLEGDPDYDDMSDKKRKYWEAQSNWHLLELTPINLKNEGVEGFRESLKAALEFLYGIICDRLSEDEIWQRIKDRAIDRFTKAVGGFVQRGRKLSLTSEKLAIIVNSHNCASDIERHFLELAQTFYKSYLEYLQATGEEDFDGLMQKATELIYSGQTVFRRKSGTGELKSLRYVFIDEYQDFSELFHHLIQAIREQNPQARFFCVGDDWQAINGFAGSDLHYYQNFAQFFQTSNKLKISTNYRSATSIVDIGNRLMQGRGTPARAYKSELGRVEIADLGTFEPTQREKENHPGDSLTPAVLRLVDKAIKDDKDIVLLSRKNSLPWYVNYQRKGNTKNNKLASFLEMVRSYLPENVRHKVTISTAHKYKGLEKKLVIVLDAVPRCYPSLHPNLIFTRVFGDSIERVIDEERRLFYVALTRAVEHLFILTETNNLSPFLEELSIRKKFSSLNWSNYPPLVGSTKSITVKVRNQDGRGGNGTYAIRDLLKAEGYNWNSPLKVWCRTYPAQGFSVQEFFDRALWSTSAVGIEVLFEDDFEQMLAIYHVERGQCTCVVDNLPELE